MKNIVDVMMMMVMMVVMMMVMMVMTMMMNMIKPPRVGVGSMAIFSLTSSENIEKSRADDLDDNIFHSHHFHFHRSLEKR